MVEKDMDQSVQQILQIVQQGTVTTVSGLQIPMLAETVCIHGDAPNALLFAKSIREALEKEGIGVGVVKS